MDATPFAAILVDLIARIPGAYGAALVDFEGETVDYAGLADPFDAKVAAAELGLILAQIGRLPILGAPRWMIARFAKRTFVTRTLPEGYTLCVFLRRRAGFAASKRAFSVCLRALAREACWPAPREDVLWVPLDVRCDRAGRPKAIVSAEAPATSPASGTAKARAKDKFTGETVEVLGTVVGLGPHERGFRVRTASGNEVTLVREAGGLWYTDEPPG